MIQKITAELIDGNPHDEGRALGGDRGLRGARAGEGKERECRE